MSDSKAQLGVRVRLEFAGAVPAMVGYLERWPTSDKDVIAIRLIPGGEIYHFFNAERIVVLESEVSDE